MLVSLAMTRRRFLWLAAAFAALPAFAQGSALIEAMLDHVGHLQGAKFIRNGTEYDASSAVKYLRHKWGEVEGVTTAEDFITRVASTSSSSGKPYQIKLADGTIQDMGDYLRGVLKKLQASH